MNFSDSWSGLIQISPIEGWFSSSLFSDIQFADIASKLDMIKILVGYCILISDLYVRTVESEDIGHTTVERKKQGQILWGMDMDLMMPTNENAFIL